MTRRVFGWHNSIPGCAYYRVQLPLSTLGQAAGWSTAWSRKLPLTSDLRAALEAGRADAPASIAAFMAERYDVVIGQQVGAGGTGADLIWQALVRHRDRHGGPMLVMETDDDLMALHSGHDQKAHSEMAERAGAYRRAIQTADLVTCTTPALAESLSRLNRVQVIPNYIDEDMFNWPGMGQHVPPRPRTWGDTRYGWVDAWPAPERMLIGWGGSSTHRNDFAIAWPSLRRLLLRRGQEVAFASMGTAHHADDPALARIERRGQFAGLAWLEMDRHPWPDYWTRIGYFDIGLAPLEKNRFNAAKSWIKILEYAAMGVPFVASASPEYQRFWEVGQSQLGQHRPDSFSMLVTTEHGWYGALRAMTESWEELRRMQARARVYARQFTIQKHIGRWASALDGWDVTLLADSQEGEEDHVQ